MQRETSPIALLLVEDDPGDARLAREMLRDVRTTHFDVAHVQRLGDALRHVATTSSDVILLDLSLPDGQGLQSLALLHAAAPHTPIVVMSACDDEALAVKGVREGAQNYLVKGRVDGHHLARALRFAIERQRTEDRLRQLAYHDPLTGLPNRSLFQDRLRQALAQARRHGHSVALLFLDLDRFKAINDTLGHDRGDELLQEVARRLRHCTREEDTVARLAGDEFVVILPDVGSRDSAAVVAQKILAALSREVTVGSRTVLITTSIGISLYPGDGYDADTLVKSADVAMYRVKRLGKNTYAFCAHDEHIPQHGHTTTAQHLATCHR